MLFKEKTSKLKIFVDVQNYSHSFCHNLVSIKFENPNVKPLKRGRNAKYFSIQNFDLNPINYYVIGFKKSHILRKCLKNEVHYVEAKNLLSI